MKADFMTNPAAWALKKVKSLKDDIWHTPPSELSRRKTFLIKQLRIIVLVGRGFLDNKVMLRASALTFYTLVSIIPVVAIALAIAKGFGLDQNLESLITNSKVYLEYHEPLAPLLDSAKETIQQTKGGYLAGVGMIILFWSVISLLNQIETSFNHIWQISSSRPWYRKFTDYLTIMLIAPVFLILSSSITAFVFTEMTDFMSRAPFLGIVKSVLSLLIKFAPYFLTWIILTILFIVMPNTKVKFMPALVSGIVAGTILKLLQWLYLDLQFGISNLNVIYGSLALIPLLIIYLQISWIIILLGAELSFANQNISRYEFESEALNVSNYQKRALIVMIMHIIIENFATGEKPIGAETIAKSLKIPVRLTRDILRELSDAELVSILHEHEQKEALYQPALDINKLTVSFVYSRLDKKGSEQGIVIKNKEYERVTSMLDKFDKLMAKSDSNILIKNL
jgi:membrane protein